MSQYLLEREQFELLKSEKRYFTMPDGAIRAAEMFNIYWRWYDRLVQYDFGIKEEAFISDCLKSLDRNPGLEFGAALAEWVEVHVRRFEEIGLDPTETDEDLVLSLARRNTMRFHERKAARSRKE